MPPIIIQVPKAPAATGPMFHLPSNKFMGRPDIFTEVHGPDGKDSYVVTDAPGKKGISDARMKDLVAAAKEEVEQAAKTTGSKTMPYPAGADRSTIYYSPVEPVMTKDGTPAAILVPMKKGSTAKDPGKADEFFLYVARGAGPSVTGPYEF